jgi:hypothetical protein
MLNDKEVSIESNPEYEGIAKNTFKGHILIKEIKENETETTESYYLSTASKILPIDGAHVVF